MDVSDRDIRIRDAGADDCPQLAAWWNDGAVMAHAGFPRGLGTTPEQIWAGIRSDTDDTRRRLIIEYERKPIGECSFRRLEDASAEIGIKICDPAYQERVLGRRALSLLIDALFSLGCEKIVLDTNLRNTRAQHVYELLGFRRVGVRYDCWTDQLGIPQSAVDYALTRADFHSYLP